MMELEPHIKEAIDAAVERHGQPQKLARYITAWLEEVVSGNETFGDQASSEQHLRLLYEATEVTDRFWEEE